MRFINLMILDKERGVRLCCKSFGASFFSIDQVDLIELASTSTMQVIGNYKFSSILLFPAFFISITRAIRFPSVNRPSFLCYSTLLGSPYLFWIILMRESET